SVEHARRASLPQREYKLLPQLAAAQFHGSTPLANLEAWLDEQEAAGRHHPGFRANRAYVHAYSGRRDEARRLIAAARAEVAERGGGGVHLGILTSVAADIEWVAGDYAAAAVLEDECIALFEETGERGWLSTMVAARGVLSYELGNLVQAAADAERALDLGASDDAITQML